MGIRVSRVKGNFPFVHSVIAFKPNTLIDWCSVCRSTAVKVFGDDSSLKFNCLLFIDSTMVFPQANTDKGTAQCNHECINSHQFLGSIVSRLLFESVPSNLPEEILLFNVVIRQLYP